jgi:uncharacterized protein YgbK (DUF1537 family)
MTDSSLPRLLAAQSRTPVTVIPLATVAAGSDAVAQAIGTTPGFLVIDAVSDDDLLTLGRAVLGAPLVTGAAGLGAALVRARHPHHELRREPLDLPTGPTAVLAGSCSTATRRQVASYGRDHPSLHLTARDALGDTAAVGRAVAFAIGQGARSPLIYSTASPDELHDTHRELGATESALGIERAFGSIARGLVDGGFRRLIVAGGETSGAVIAALGVTAVEIGPELDPGVPWTASLGQPRLALLLKSGNFGAPDIFERALT